MSGNTREFPPHLTEGSRRPNATRRHLVLATALLLVGCGPKVRAPVFAEAPTPADLPPIRPEAVVPPGGCRGQVLRPGVTVDCTGIAIAVTQAERDEAIGLDLGLCRTEAARIEGGRIEDRATCEAEAARLGTALDDAERQLRTTRTGLSIVGGALVVLAAAVGVNAALR